MKRTTLTFVCLCISGGVSADDAALRNYQSGRDQMARIVQAAGIARVRLEQMCDEAPREGEDPKFCHGRAAASAFVEACATFDDPVARLSCFDLVADQTADLFRP